jgi:hypothetical protein
MMHEIPEIHSSKNGGLEQVYDKFTAHVRQKPRRVSYSGAKMPVAGTVKVAREWLKEWLFGQDCPTEGGVERKSSQSGGVKR